MNAEADHAPLRKLTARRSRRALLEYYECTDRHNCERILRLIDERGPGVTWVHVRRFVASLPQILRAESQVANAIAADIDPRSRASDLEYREQIERARVLAEWATQCEYPSAQDQCLELVRKAIAKRTA